MTLPNAWILKLRSSLMQGMVKGFMFAQMKRENMMRLFNQ